MKPMDGISLAGVGVVSMAMQCFSAVTASISLIQDMKDLDSKSALLRCKLQIEQHLLLTWGQEHGLMDGTLEARVPDATCRRLILAVLRNMLGLVVETDKLRSRYGLDHVSQLSSDAGPSEQKVLGARVETQGSSSVPIANFTSLDISAAATAAQDGNGSSSNIELDVYGINTAETQTALQKWKMSAQWTRKFKWLIKDATKFNELVDHLRYFNQSLDRLTDSRHRTLLGAGSALVTHSSPADLQVIEAASASLYPEFSAAAAICRRTAEVEAGEVGNAGGPGVYPQQPGAANTTSTPSPQRATRIASSQVRLAHKSASKTLTAGTYASPHLGERAVLVHWRPFRDPLNAATSDKTTRRIESTALILSQAKPQTLAVLDCLGYMVADDGSRLGYVFSFPRDASPDRTPRTLLQLLTPTPESRYGIPPPPLELRIQLAHRLCTTVYWLHVGGLVHKGIRPDNILLFRHGAERTERLADPFLLGFDHSRRDDDQTVTRTASTPDQDLYRHPDFFSAATTRTTKLHDLYSLGLVLLEIGSWFPLAQLAAGAGRGRGRDMNAPPDSSSSAWELREHLLMDGGPVAQLAYRTGTRYMELVRTCLRGSFDVTEEDLDLDGTAVQGAFCREVVEELDKVCL
ncbi:prion-inhibition and propagation-domain-containing protein [Cercophora scortea]|uniref:Prion-inhibition and propagation-domain-containing protein n=1 Tax=Cercophora scortea TaxID=314031 RepID=A0AAE0I740_9PEZI|nr:prion-inhibition and propagation-domain-containing protein [Cercophora scortea]